MTVGEWALLIGLLANAAVSCLCFRLTHKVELATNSMKDELVSATRALALLQGEAKGHADAKGELKNGTSDDPLAVADERTAVAAERVAEATERVATAAEKNKKA